MYVKPQRKQFQGGIYVPENYHGTAFTEPEEPGMPAERDSTTETAASEPAHTAEHALPASKKEEGGLLSSLFSGFGGLRSDDLLLLALIVLLFRSSGKEGNSASEILPLLALLLFMG